MKCQNANCNNNLSIVLKGYQRLTCSRKCQYDLRTLNSQNTCLEKYGTVSNSGSADAKLKRRATSLEKYGSETYNNRNKSEITLLNNFGVKNVSQLQTVKDKKTQSVLDHYGVTNPNKSPVIKEKSKNTKLKKYGTSTYNNRDKAKETSIEKFGVDHAMKDPMEVEKLRQVFIEKLGVDNPSKLQTVKDKKSDTCRKNYGVENPSHSPEILKRIIDNSYLKKPFTLPSGKELKLMGFEPVALKMLLDTEYSEIDFDFDNIPKIRYHFDNADRIYIPDFYIPAKNLIIEVKSTFTYDLHKMQNLVKKAATIAAGYSFRFLIVDKKGKIINEPEYNV